MLLTAKRQKQLSLGLTAPPKPILYCKICDSKEEVKEIDVGEAKELRCRICRNNNGTKFPIEPGWYWFFGFKSSWDKHFEEAFDGSKQLHMVKVEKRGSNLVYFFDGEPITRYDGTEGVFEKAVMPTSIDIS